LNKREAVGVSNEAIGWRGQQVTRGGVCRESEVRVVGSQVGGDSILYRLLDIMLLPEGIERRLAISNDGVAGSKKGIDSRLVGKTKD
jgi:hypothetical protein